MLEEQGMLDDANLMTEELELQQNKMKPVRFLKQLLSVQHMKLEKNKTKGMSFMSSSLI